jgi:hypothetical protein
MALDTDVQLDLLSTSQTKPYFCPFGAPLVAIIISGVAAIRQTCCNHWECPICGGVRAKQEYHRIVYGAEKLSEKHKLYFWTLTCRGRELSLKDAEENYYAWTNVLLTNARTKAKRANLYWAYVQVTERQKKTRAHPHSHCITSFLPDDAVGTTDRLGRTVYVSRWFSAANDTAGLGNQHRISKIDSPEAVSRYVAKYLFKDSAKDVFPPKWKRVRYSQNYPKPPEVAPDFSLVLRTRREWDKVGTMPVIWKMTDMNTAEYARHRIGNVVVYA